RAGQLTERIRRLGEEIREGGANARGRGTFTAGVSIGGVTVASAGFVLWTLRGAAGLGAALASASPAWAALDPLALFARRRGAALAAAWPAWASLDRVALLPRRRDEDEEDDSLAELAGQNT